MSKTPEAKEEAAKKAAEIKDKAADKAAEIKEKVTEKAAEIKDKAADKKAEITEKKAEIKEEIADKKAEIKEEISEKKAKIADKKAEITEKVAEKKNEISEKATEKKNEISEKIAEKKAEIKEEISEKKAKIKDKITESAAEAKKEAETFAKSGKKSKKHIEEVKAEEARQARKAERALADATPNKPKGATPVTRSRLERRGRKYQEKHKLIEKDKTYTLKDALDLAIKTSPVKFDATVEIHAKLGVDPRQADQNIRTTLVLPNGNGKTVRIAVFAPLDICKKAISAGADIAEDEEFLKRLEKGTLDFDVLISTPQYMPKLGKYARLLGPKGLMPNPKAGTVTTDVEKAVKDAKAGKVEYRVDKQAIVHLGIGKVSFDTNKLLENANAFFNSLKSQKPASLKGNYVKSVYITTSMGPSIQIENLYN